MSEGVLLDPGLPALPEELLLARDRGQVLFIVGAGASYPAPSLLPDFKGLVADIYSSVDPSVRSAMDLVKVKDGPKWDDQALVLSHEQRTELKFFCKGEYDVALGMLERRIDGDPSKQSRMRLATHEALAQATEPNSIHDALVRLGQRYGRTLLVTTNFDRLLSEAAKRSRFSHDAYALGEAPNPSRSTEFNGILHIHGKLAWKKEKASNIILTDQDFGDAYLRRHLITYFLYDAARIFHLVLVGYSANDSPVRYLLNAIAGDERHFVDLKKRYAFVGCDPADERMSVEWQSRGIMPIAYDRANNHAALGHLLNQWADSIPDNRNKARLNAKLAHLATLDPASAEGQAHMSFVRYHYRRSTPMEQTALAKLFSRKGASPGWLSFLNKVIREAEGGAR